MLRWHFQKGTNSMDPPTSLLTFDKNNCIGLQWWGNSFHDVCQLPISTLRMSERCWPQQRSLSLATHTNHMRMGRFLKKLNIEWPYDPANSLFLACVRISLLSKTEQYFTVHIQHTLLIHSTVDGHVGCFYSEPWRIMLLWMLVYKDLFESLLSILWGEYPVWINLEIIMPSEISQSQKDK